ncbi:MAG: ATP-binding cassette domain-containing protein [Bacteroidales bacterium]|nr:ATP-binding cassette domain-containing protein [Bacteroidales bacterium]
MFLRIQNLSTYFFLDEGIIRAVDQISFDINEQETVAIVGESGCGKTLVALSLLNLVPLPGRIVGGNIYFQGKDLLKLDKRELTQIRGKDISMVFQEPGAALNPVFTIGYQIREVLRRHCAISVHESKIEAVKLLGKVGIPEPEKRMKAYPYELSGGMKQRVVIAMAMGTHPKLLIADEPTSALDMTVQADILDLFGYLKEKYKMSILLITHDLGIVSEIAQRVLVMYTGKLLESAPTEDLFRKPNHPYTIGLLNLIPRLGEGRKTSFHGITGSVPDFFVLPSGCTFHPRCALSDDSCTFRFPETVNISPNHSCACYKIIH